MTTVNGFLRSNAARLLAVAAIVTLYWLTPPRALSESERAALASRFHFTQFMLPEVPGYESRAIRKVNPSLQNIAAWISSVGAAVALNDLDGDGLPNDVCSVDTRTDQIIVASAPGTPTRFTPFVLSAAPLPYETDTMAPMGCLPADLNEDGAMDIVAYYWGRTPVAFLRRQGATGTPLSGDSYVRQEIVPEGGRWFTNAATMADIDGDGHIDLLIGNYFPDGARILDSKASNQEYMQDSMSRAYNGGFKHFLLWSGASAGAAPSVRFQDRPSGLEEYLVRGWTLGLGAADLDGDLLPEIYIANDFGPDRLLHNESRPGQLQFTPLEGRKSFFTPGSKVLGHDSFKGMGVDFGDLNADGIPDIYVSDITTEFALQESQMVFLSTGEPLRPASGIAPYVDRSEQLGLSRTGWAWEARLDDFDNDGVLEALQATGFVKGTINRWPDLHELAMGNDWMLKHPTSWLNVQPGDDLAGHQPNPFFARAADGRYYDLSSALDLDTPYVSRGIATADVEGDGRLDYAVANQWEPSVFYHNESRNAGAFLGLHLILPPGSDAPANTRVWPGRPAEGPRGWPAIGAQATVYLPDGRRLGAQVDGGNGHSGKRSPEIHLGLGQLAPETPLRVDLRWRDANGQVQQWQTTLTPGWHTILLGS